MRNYFLDFEKKKIHIQNVNYSISNTFTFKTDMKLRHKLTAA